MEAENVSYIPFYCTYCHGETAVSADRSPFIPRDQKHNDIAPYHHHTSAVLSQEADGRLRQGSAQLIRIPEAAKLTGLPSSLLRKSFMREEKRPKNIPPPPPHKRIGRAVYIVADALPGWIDSLGRQPEFSHDGKRRRGRPTVAERITRLRQEQSDA